MMNRHENDNYMDLLEQQRKIIQQQEELIQKQKKYIESQFDLLQQHKELKEHEKDHRVEEHEEDHRVEGHEEDNIIKDQHGLSYKGQEINDQLNEQETNPAQIKLSEPIHNISLSVLKKASDTLPNNESTIDLIKFSDKDKLNNLKYKGAYQSLSQMPIPNPHVRENNLGIVNNFINYEVLSLSNDKVNYNLASIKNPSPNNTNSSSKKRRFDMSSEEFTDNLTPSIFDFGSFQAADYQLETTDENQTEKSKELSLVPMNNSKTKRRIVIKTVKHLKDPYLHFGVDEEFLVAQLHEVKQLICNEATAYYVENNFESYMNDVDRFLKIAENKVSSWGDYAKELEHGRFVTMKIVSKFGNSLIPCKFGKFPEKFLVNILEYTFGATCEIEQAIFSALDQDYPDLYTQQFEKNYMEWSDGNKDFMEKNLSHLKDYAPIKYENLSVFKSPWCSSYQDEQFYMNTIKELGLELKRYPRIVGIATMMSMVIQPESSPFSKSKNLHRFFKELASLLNRYLVAINDSAAKASEDCERIISLLMKLPRCSDIFLNKRLE